MNVLMATCSALVLTGSFIPGDADEPKPASAERPASTASQGARSVDENAIHAMVDSFLRAYNAGDAKALASQFTEDAEVVDVDGTRHHGRDVIEKLFTATFTGSPGVRMTATVDSLRFLSADVAKEEGRSTMTPASGGPVSRRYTVLYVKRGDRWLHDSVREEPELQIRPHDRLKELEWMVGDWVDEGADSEVQVTCRWSDDENYLLRTFTVKVRGKAVMTVSQRIGWDPLNRQIKSWEFDSEGGYGEGLWTRDGKRWTVEHAGVLADGQTASATRIMVLENANRVRWTSTEQVVGGQPAPEGEAYVMVRRPPPPAPSPNAEPNVSPTPSTPRRTR
ncbi:MAG TPA: SgcJ/EcaC family oxidoreductase [Isosphaeraceae bacterium]|jgi:uncharacterized protein (TIGR02246 family)|nr:SgcJ/EcaC family oxidoreductase [Isosphaeraceae bacterium]